MPFVLPVGVKDWCDGVTVLKVQPLGASGTPTIVGTPIPTGNYVRWSSKGNLQPFTEEMSGSPRGERAEQCTCEHRLKMDLGTAYYYWTLMPRGLVVSDTDANIWRILSCEYTRIDVLQGAELHYVMEALSFDSPPDDFSAPAVALDLHIIKHPRYWWALSPYESENSPTIAINDIRVSITEIKEAIIRMIQNYIESPFYPSQNQTNSLIQINIINGIENGTFQLHYANPTFDPSRNIVDPVVWSGKNSDLVGLGNPNCAYYLIPVKPTDYTDDDPETGPIHIALAAAKELISKLWRQEDTPYLVGRKMRWTQYFFAPIYLNPGGYREDPRDWVPSYFMNPEVGWPPSNIQFIPRGDQGSLGQDPDPGVDGTWPGANADTQTAGGAGSPSILDWMKLYNPQSYSDDGTVNGNLQISSLREADDVEYQRTWFAVTHEWLVAPIGKWDIDLYKELGESGPQVASDFNKNPINQSHN